METALGKQSKEGMTLAETMVASMVLLMVLSGISANFIYSTRLLYIADYHYASACIARTRIELARTMPFTTLQQIAEGGMAASATRCDRYGDASPTGSFARATVIAAAAANTNCVRVTVSVWYLLRGNWVPTPIQMSTMITDEAQ